MDYKFLNKVVDQIVSETKIKVGRKKKYRLPFLFYPFHSFLAIKTPFFNHCKDVYGLNEQEIEYVWNEYKKIIKDKIEK